jgi:hypothetical protein
LCSSFRIKKAERNFSLLMIHKKELSLEACGWN